MKVRIPAGSNAELGKIRGRTASHVLYEDEKRKKEGRNARIRLNARNFLNYVSLTTSRGCTVHAKTLCMRFGSGQNYSDLTIRVTGDIVEEGGELALRGALSFRENHSLMMTSSRSLDETFELGRNIVEACEFATALREEFAGVDFYSEEFTLLMKRKLGPAFCDEDL